VQEKPLLDAISQAIYLFFVRVVLDTAVLVAAIRSDTGASRCLLISALDKRFEVILSVPLMLEYEAVLKTTEHMVAAGARANDIDAILDALAAVGTPVTPVFSWRPQLIDPGDEMVLETAVNGHADLVVTFNQKHFSGPEAAAGIMVRAGMMMRRREIWHTVRTTHYCYPDFGGVSYEKE
jgi:putative PIN family toxin of toxin-antitoxin system